MPLRNKRPGIFRPKGLSDTIDASNSFAGAMQSLQNLVPAPQTQSIFIPRPASTTVTSFAGFTSPGQVTALFIVGDIAYGMISETSGTFNGKDIPFAYNLATNTFETITIPGGAASLPTSPATTGDWTPPILAQVGTKIIITHPGYPGTGGIFFGWLDLSGFTSASVTGDTHTSTLVDNLSTNVLIAGYQPGQTITGSGFQANTTIVSIASNGLSLVLSKPTTTSVAGTTLTVAGGTKTAPLYGSGNTNPVGLSAVPVSVAQFNGRAYYAVSNGVVYSDSGAALEVTNATQAITFQNGLNVTALVGLPLTNTTVGGIIQSIICFQGQSQMWQITGDQATSNLASNEMNVSTGTLSPLTICPTPDGIMFVSPDGLRVINFAAQISKPIGIYGSGVSLPFMTAINPSRMCAAYNNSVIRISAISAMPVSGTASEYWYDFNLEIWTGPHTFPAGVIAPWDGTASTFIMSGYKIGGKLWRSDPIPNTTSVYVENSIQITCAYQTSLMPDNQEMAENCTTEGTIMASLPYGSQLTVIVIDDVSNTLDTLTISGAANPPPIWGTFTWGAAIWGNVGGYLYQHPLKFHLPIVYKQMWTSISFNAQAGIAIGNLRMDYQVLGYLTQAAS